MGFFNRLRSDAVHALESELAIQRNDSEFLREEVAHMRESMSELEREMNGYDQIGSSETDVSQAALVRRAGMNRNAFFLNPMIHRAAQVIVNYVWALGMRVHHTDSAIDVRVQAMFRDEDNRICVFGSDALAKMERDLLLSGNVFITVQTGEIPSVREIPLSEIQEILRDPQDPQLPYLYKRVYSVDTFDMKMNGPRLQARTEYYHDARVPLARRMPSIGTYVVHDAVIVHMSVDRVSNMQFGMPELQSAMSWSRAYKDFLENWIKILSAYAKIAWKYITKGGKRATNAAQARLGTTVTGTSLTERNPPPTTGAMVAMGSGDDIEPMRTGGATENPESARRVHLMTVAGSGLPETMFGDQISGVENTETHLDRPTELLIMQRQNRWIETFRRVIASALALSPEERDGITVDFPDIVGRNVREIVSALVDAATCKGLPFAGVMDMRTFSRKVLHELRIPNADTLVMEMYPDEEYNPQDWAVATPSDMRDQMSAQQNSGSESDPNADDEQGAPSSKTQLRPGRTPGKPGRTRPNDTGPRT